MPGLRTLVFLIAPISGSGGANIIEPTAPAPHRGDFKAMFDRKGVVFWQLPDAPDFEKVVLRRVTSYLKPRLDLHSGIRRKETDPLPPPEGWPMSDPNSTTKLGSSPLRRIMQAGEILAPADDTVQGPHQEHDIGLKVVCIFYCEQPSVHGGGTALFDMQKAWQKLPRDLQEKFRSSKWRLPGIEDLPCAVRHPRTGRPILVFYCFGRLARDCVDMYRSRTGKYHVREDPYSYGILPEYDALIVDANGIERPFIGLDLYRTLDSIYDSMVVHLYGKGDALIVDNIRWAHARLEGAGSGRKVHFAWYGYPNMTCCHPLAMSRPRLDDLNSV